MDVLIYKLFDWHFSVEGKAPSGQVNTVSVRVGGRAVPLQAVAFG